MSENPSVVLLSEKNTWLPISALSCLWANMFLLLVRIDILTICLIRSIDIPYVKGVQGYMPVSFHIPNQIWICCFHLWFIHGSVLQNELVLELPQTSVEKNNMNDMSTISISIFLLFNGKNHVIQHHQDHHCHVLGAELGHSFSTGICKLLKGCAVLKHRTTYGTNGGWWPWHSVL